MTVNLAVEAAVEIEEVVAEDYGMSEVDVFNTTEDLLLTSIITTYGGARA